MVNHAEAGSVSEPPLKAIANLVPRTVIFFLYLVKEYVVLTVYIVDLSNGTPGFLWRSKFSSVGGGGGGWGWGWNYFKN